MKKVSHKPNASLIRHLNKALPIAKKSALEAGQFLIKKYGRFKSLKEKLDLTLVTEADRGSENIIVKNIQKHFPTDIIIGEEGGLRKSATQSMFRWHIDPLDGTTNFVHGFPMFCISIGLEFEDNGPVLGVVYAPLLKNLYESRLGGGCYLNSKKIKVSKTKSVRNSLLTTGFSYKQEKFMQIELENFSNVLHACRATRRIGSAALDLATVAVGQFDGFWERGLSSWDVVAGVSLVSEAGGTVTTIDGNQHMPTSESIVASNGIIHNEFIEVFKNRNQ